MKCATLAQGNQILSLILQKDLTADQVQQIESSRFLDILLEGSKSINLATLDPFALRQLFGLETLDYLPHGPICEFETDHHPAGKKVEVMEIKKIIETYLGSAFNIDVSSWTQKGYEDLDCNSKVRVKMFAINRGSIDGCEKVCRDKKIIPATRRELAKFAHARPILEDNINAHIIGLGSCLKNDGATRCWEYPYLTYTDGKLVECGSMRRDILVRNGDAKFECYRDFFLGRFEYWK